MVESLVTEPLLTLALIYAYYKTHYRRWPTQEVIWAAMIHFITTEPIPVLMGYARFGVERRRANAGLYQDLQVLSAQGYLVFECGELRLTTVGMEMAEAQQTRRSDDLRLIHIVELDAAQAA